MHGWSEAEYILWVQKHQDEKEQWALVESAVDDQTGKDEGDEEHVRLIKEVLVHAREEGDST